MKFEQQQPKQKPEHPQPQQQPNLQSDLNQMYSAGQKMREKMSGFQQSFQQNNPQQPFEPQQQMPPIGPQDKISKRLTAMEVYREVVQMRWLTVISIAGYLVLGFLMLYSSRIGMAATLILSGISGFFMWKTTTRLNYLEKTYQLKQSPGMPIK